MYRARMKKPCRYGAGLMQGKKKPRAGQGFSGYITGISASMINRAMPLMAFTDISIPHRHKDREDPALICAHWFNAQRISSAGDVNHAGISDFAKL